MPIAKALGIQPYEVRTMSAVIASERLRQLLDLAREGHAEAAADLGREFGFRIEEDQ